MQDLVRSRPSYDQVASKLRDGNLDLRTVVGGEKARDERMAGEPLTFGEDVQPLFRGKDVEEMKDIANLDLSNYEDVRSNAEIIYARLDDGTMPCDGPWPDENIETFRRWIDQGKKL